MERVRVPPIGSTLLYPSLCWNELRLCKGWWRPIHGSVFFEQLPLSYLPDFGHFFLQKVHDTYIAGMEEKFGVQMLFKPPQKGWFLRALSLFHNWGSLSKIEGKHLWWSHRLLLLQGQHVALAFPKRRGVPQFWRTSWHLAMIKQSCKRQGNDKKLLFSKLRAVP